MFLHSCYYKQYLIYVYVEFFFTDTVTRVRIVSRRLLVKTELWNKPGPILLSCRKRYVCKDRDDEYNLVLFCPRYGSIRKTYIPPYFRFLKYPSMFKFIELYNVSYVQILLLLNVFN